jgi:hypothetical protein
MRLVFFNLKDTPVEVTSTYDRDQLLDYGATTVMLAIMEGWTPQW